MPKGHFILYLKARNLVSEGCVYNLVQVNDSTVEMLLIQAVRVVKEFLEVFLDDLPEFPPKREIDFGIEFFIDIRPISIPPYKMAPGDLKEFRENFKDLLVRALMDQVSHLGELLYYL